MAGTVVVDCDPGCDDAVALLAALGCEELGLNGVTTVGGNTTVENATWNALAALDLAGSSVPVAAGCARPLVETLETAEHVHGEGGLRGNLPTPAADPVDVHGASFIAERARRVDDLALIAVGPLTNVAVALALEPELPDLLDETYVMGGSAFAPGNRTPVSEANVYTDPAAARKVVSELSPKLVGLDVTRRAQLPPDEIGRFSGADDAARRAVGVWLDYYPDELLDARGYQTSPQHDAVAVAAAATDAVTFERHPVEVVDDRGQCRGQLLVDAGGSADYRARADVAVGVDAPTFRRFLVESLERALPAP